MVRPVMQNEIRRDYVLERYAIIAAERAGRPTDFTAKPSESDSSKRDSDKNCPFCMGNELMTPPADLVYMPKDGGVIKEKDSNGFRQKGWAIRCFPNLYPALTPNAKALTSGYQKLNLKSPAYGFHEIVVESPNHDEHPHKARLKQLEFVLDACLELSKKFYSDPNIQYVQIFRNHKKEAGASLSHAHTQIIATPIIPPIVREEFNKSVAYYKEEGECVFCRIIADEKKGPRLIYEGESFVVIAPWASIHPFEFWIMPKSHESDLINVTDLEKQAFAKTLRISLGGLAGILDDPPYNYGFHISPVYDRENEYYHWHLEVYPKLSTWAGFELCTGMYLNVMPPETAAESLRGSLNAELGSLAI